MKNNIILFRCITEPSKGYGNFNRCITLAVQLEKYGFNPFFIIENTNVKKTLEKKDWNYKIIPHYSSKEKESKLLINFMERNQIKMIILDMREYAEKISYYLYKNNFKTILIDDAWTKNAFADVIINGTNVKKYHKYILKNKDSKLYLGYKYWIANLEFTRNRKKLSEIVKKKKYTLTISLGGSDPHNLTEFLIHSIKEMPNVKLNAIIGPFFKNKKSLLKIKENNITFFEDAENIWKIFHGSDLVISGCGNTLFELAIQKIPTICIPLVPHQVPYANSFKDSGFCIVMRNIKSLKKSKIQNSLNLLLNNEKKRRKMSQIGGKLLDGNGLHSSTKIIQKFILKYNGN